VAAKKPQWSTDRLPDGKLRGVHLVRNRYQAGIRVNGQYERLGTYDTPELAAAAYDRRAREVYGSNALTNFDAHGNRTNRIATTTNKTVVHRGQSFYARTVIDTGPYATLSEAQEVLDK